MKEKPLDEQLLLFKSALADILTIAESYPETLQTQSGACGEWSAREIIAHINGWMVEGTRRLPRFAKGTGQIEYNIDAFNAVSVWLREDKDYQQLLDEMRSLTSQIVAFIDDLEDFYRNRDERYSTWLRILAHEATHHREDLETFLATNT